MKYRELIQFNPIDEIIKFEKLDNEDYRTNVVKNFVCSETFESYTIPTICKHLDFSRPVETKGIQIVGNYGTGKSHLMSVIAAVATDEENLQYLQNKNFGPKPFWQISATVHKDMTNFDVLSKRKYDNEQEARDDEKRVSSSKQMRVVSVEKKRVNTKPPLLYDLTELQRQANSKHGLTAE
jgi:ATPase subunit of ABC transporter with duplicated ATPase domains